MDKQEIKITDNLWPILVKKTKQGEIEANCPFFTDCQAKGQTTEEAIKKVEKIIVARIDNFRPLN